MERRVVQREQSGVDRWLRRLIADAWSEAGTGRGWHGRASAQGCASDAIQTAAEPGIPRGHGTGVR
jgi:hypothetical protein